MSNRLWKVLHETQYIREQNTLSKFKICTICAGIQIANNTISLYFVANLPT